MRKFITLLVLATFAGSLTFGAAASLAISADDLASGSAPIGACDTNGVTIDYIYGATAPVTLEELVIGDIDDTCDSQLLDIELRAMDGTVVWSLQSYIPIDPGSTSMTISTVGEGIVPDVTGEVWLTISGRLGF